MWETRGCEGFQGHFRWQQEEQGVDPLQPPHPLWQSWTTDVLFLNIIFWVKKKDSLGEKLQLRPHCGLPHVIYSTGKSLQHSAVFSVLHFTCFVYLRNASSILLCCFLLNWAPPLYNFSLAVNGRPWSHHNFGLSFKGHVSSSPAAMGVLVGGDLGAPRLGFSQPILKHQWHYHLGMLSQILKYRRPLIPSPAPSFPCALPLFLSAFSIFYKPAKYNTTSRTCL